MVDVSIVTETPQEANWNRQTGRQADAQDHVLSQADALTNKLSDDIKKNSSDKYKKRYHVFSGVFDFNIRPYGKFAKVPPPGQWWDTNYPGYINYQITYFKLFAGHQSPDILSILVISFSYHS